MFADANRQPDRDSHSAGNLNSAPNALPIGTRLGEFEISRVLGAGGFGIVYLATDHALQREVAIKEYMPASLAGRTETLHLSLHSQTDAATFALGLKSFVNEARLLARFDHPSLLKVLRFWESNGTAYMAMPVMRGSTWKDVRLALDGPPTEAWVLRLLMPLLGAIERLHAEGVYHRDISPDNIQIEANGNPVLLDFGAARHVISDKSLALTTILKPAYAPIEQYAEQGSVKQGPWTDLYSLGATLHYVLLARPPVPATVRAVHDDPSPLTTLALPGCSDRFLRTVDWMLAPRPSDRPRSVAELRAVLEGHVEPPPRAALLPPAAHSWDVTQMLPAAGGVDLPLQTFVAAKAGVPDEITRPSWLLRGADDQPLPPPVSAPFSESSPASAAAAKGYADEPLPASASVVQRGAHITLPPPLVSGEQVRSIISPLAESSVPTAAQAAWVQPAAQPTALATNSRRNWLPLAVFVAGLLATLVVVANFWQPQAADAPKLAQPAAAAASTATATALAPAEVILPNTVREPVVDAAAPAAPLAVVAPPASSALTSSPLTSSPPAGLLPAARVDSPATVPAGTAKTAARNGLSPATRADASKAANATDAGPSSYVAQPPATATAATTATSYASPSAAPATPSAAATVAPRPTPAADGSAAAGPEASCTGKSGMAGFFCMERACGRAENVSHPDCLNWHKNAKRE
jgi:serine/threonine protein kinase